MPRVLVIEDTRTVQQEILRILESAGYEGLAADNGKAGLRLAREQLPDLILCDIMMPEIDGFDVLTELRGDPTIAWIPFIFLSALHDNSDRRRGMNLGADDYLTKPFRVRELLDVVQLRLARQAVIIQSLDQQRSRLARSGEDTSRYDGLTELPNRRLLQDWLAREVQLHRPGHELGVVAIDIDRFRHVNDALGRKAGDQLLRVVAERLRNTELPPGSTLFRSGESEFVALLPRLAEQDMAEQVGLQILKCIKQPVALKEHALHITASIGISLHPLHGGDPETLLLHARLAMHQAKEQGHNNVQVYQAAMRQEVFDRLLLETDLRHALKRNALELHYQPQIDLRSGAIVGMEALARWNHPELGLISPGRFIPVAEECDLIQPLGEWTLKTACAQAKQIQSRGFPELRVAVNVSGSQFQSPEIVEIVNSAMQAAQLQPHTLEIELTESVLVKNPKATVARLEELKSKGVSVSIDDFGTGYSSLAYLRRFPIDTLKIDQSFTRDVTTSPEGAAIATAIIQVAHGLNFKAVAEGVETREQVEFLRAHNCDCVQGYFFSKPVPAENFMRLMEDGRRLLAKP